MTFDDHDDDSPGVSADEAFGTVERMIATRLEVMAAQDEVRAVAARLVADHGLAGANEILEPAASVDCDGTVRFAHSYQIDEAWREGVGVALGMFGADLIHHLPDDTRVDRVTGEVVIDGGWGDDGADEGGERS